MKMFILSRKLVFCSMIVRIFSGTVPFKPWGFSQKAVQAEPIGFNASAAVVNEFDDAVMRIDAGAKNAQIY